MAKRNRESEGEENIESRDGKGHLGQASFGATLPSDNMALTRVLPLNDGPLPKLVIVDLDKTLWPFYCHEQTMGPYERHEKASDAVHCRSRNGTGKVVRLFPDVLEVLRCLKHQGSILLAVASRSPIETAGRGIMGALEMLDLFCCLEIHRGSKAEHASNIMAATGVPYRDMMFLDDSKSNIKNVQKLGVCCIKVSQDTGLTFEAVRSGLEKYRTLCSTRSKMREWFQPPIQQTRENTSGASYAEGIVSEEARHTKQDNTP